MAKTCWRNLIPFTKKEKKVKSVICIPTKEMNWKYLSTGTAFMFIHPRTTSTYFSIWMIINMFTSYQNPSYLIWEHHIIFRCILLFTSSVSYPVQHSRFWHSSLLAHSILRYNWGPVSERLRDIVVYFDYSCVSVSRQKNWVHYEYMLHYPAYQKGSLFQFFLFQVMCVSKENSKYRVNKISLTQLKMIACFEIPISKKHLLWLEQNQWWWLRYKNPSGHTCTMLHSFPGWSRPTPQNVNLLWLPTSALVLFFFCCFLPFFFPYLVRCLCSQFIHLQLTSAKWTVHKG